VKNARSSLTLKKLFARIGADSTARHRGSQVERSPLRSVLRAEIMPIWIIGGNYRQSRGNVVRAIAVQPLFDSNQWRVLDRQEDRKGYEFQVY
jgi:hypothetical protein